MNNGISQNNPGDVSSPEALNQAPGAGKESMVTKIMSVLEQVGTVVRDFFVDNEVEQGMPEVLDPKELVGREVHDALSTAATILKSVPRSNGKLHCDGIGGEKVDENTLLTYIATQVKLLTFMGSMPATEQLDNWLNTFAVPALGNGGYVTVPPSCGAGNGVVYAVAIMLNNGKLNPSMPKELYPVVVRGHDGRMYFITEADAIRNRMLINVRSKGWARNPIAITTTCEVVKREPGSKPKVTIQEDPRVVYEKSFLTRGGRKGKARYALNYATREASAMDLAKFNALLAFLRWAEGERLLSRNTTVHEDGSVTVTVGASHILKGTASIGLLYGENPIVAGDDLARVYSELAESQRYVLDRIDQGWDAEGDLPGTSRYDGAPEDGEDGSLDSFEITSPDGATFAATEFASAAHYWHGLVDPCRVALNEQDAWIHNKDGSFTRSPNEYGTADITPRDKKSATPRWNAYGRLKWTKDPAGNWTLVLDKRGQLVFTPDVTKVRINKPVGPIGVRLGRTVRSRVYTVSDYCARLSIAKVANRVERLIGEINRRRKYGIKQKFGFPNVSAAQYKEPKRHAFLWRLRKKLMAIKAAKWHELLQNRAKFAYLSPMIGGGEWTKPYVQPIVDFSDRRNVVSIVQTLIRREDPALHYLVETKHPEAFGGAHKEGIMLYRGHCDKCHTKSMWEPKTEWVHYEDRSEQMITHFTLQPVWVKRPHDFVCRVCNTQVWRKRVVALVPAHLFRDEDGPFINVPKPVTHIGFRVYGEMAGQIMERKLEVEQLLGRKLDSYHFWMRPWEIKDLLELAGSTSASIGNLQKRLKTDKREFGTGSEPKPALLKAVKDLRQLTKELEHMRKVAWPAVVLNAVRRYECHNELPSFKGMHFLEAKHILDLYHQKASFIPRPKCPEMTLFRWVPTPSRKKHGIVLQQNAGRGVRVMVDGKVTTEYARELLIGKYDPTCPRPEPKPKPEFKPERRPKPEPEPKPEPKRKRMSKRALEALDKAVREEWRQVMRNRRREERLRLAAILRRERTERAAFDKWFDDKKAAERRMALELVRVALTKAINAIQAELDKA